MKTISSARPLLAMIDTEAEILAELAMQVEKRSPEISALLVSEIDRATLYTADALPPDVVTMGSRVEFIDEGSGARREVELVYPADADIAAGRISILTPVGAGLIGLQAGQSISWPYRDGHQRRLAIKNVWRPVTA